MIKRWIGSLRSMVYHRDRMKRFHRELIAFAESGRGTRQRFTLDESDLMPCLDDNTSTTGFDRHYIFHVAWAIRVVKKINPTLHIDFSSSLSFCTAISAFVPTRFYDYRPAELELDGLTSLAGDLTSIQLPDNSVESLSCMHTFEHVGLGRYGDQIDYDGDLKAIRELKRVVRPGGSLLFVTPVGKPRIQFNAHRIYSFDQVTELFEGFQLKEFSLVPDNPAQGGLIQNASREQANEQWYGCGCFWWIKI